MRDTVLFPAYYLVGIPIFRNVFRVWRKYKGTAKRINFFMRSPEVLPFRCSIQRRFLQLVLSLLSSLTELSSFHIRMEQASLFIYQEFLLNLSKEIGGTKSWIKINLAPQSAQ
jgi:hypothetical protein